MDTRLSSAERHCLHLDSVSWRWKHAGGLSMGGMKTSYSGCLTCSGRNPYGASVWLNREFLGHRYVFLLGQHGDGIPDVFLLQTILAYKMAVVALKVMKNNTHKGLQTLKEGTALDARCLGMWLSCQCWGLHTGHSSLECALVSSLADCVSFCHSFTVNDNYVARRHCLPPVFKVKRVSLFGISSTWLFMV